MKATSIHVGTRNPKWKILTETQAAYIAEMDTELWTALPGHPRHRDARRQSQKAHWDLVRCATGAAEESLRWLIAADCNGQIFKVQGHARCHLWEKEGLEKPSSIYATVFRCATWQGLLDLHSAFDSKDAAETAYDKVGGAHRQHGLDLKSKRLRYGMIADALWLALRGVARRSESGAESGLEEIDVYVAARDFRNELQLLDLAIEPKGISFFEALQKNEGSKRGTLLDPVEASRVHIDAIKKSKSSWVKAQHEDLCGKILRAFFNWTAGAERTEHSWAANIVGAENVPEIVQRVKDINKKMGDRPET
jgi:hypothetical protein